MHRSENYGTSTQYDDTEGWLDDVLGRAPKRVEPKTGFETEPLVYTSKRKSNTCVDCMSHTILALNVLFFLIGGAVIAFSLLMMKNDSWNKICTDCTNFFYFTIGVGGLVMVISVIGILGSKCSKIALSIYSCFMVVATIIQIVIIVLIVLLAQGVFMNHFGSLWKSAVKSDAHAVCDVQNSLNCSGWDHCCDCVTPPAIDGNSSNSDYCPGDCEWNVNLTPCKNKIKDDLNDNLPWVISTSAGVLLLFVLCLVFSCLVRRRYKKRSDYD